MFRKLSAIFIFLALAAAARVSAQTVLLQNTQDNNKVVIERTIDDAESQLKLKECRKGSCWLLEGFLKSLKSGERGDGIRHEWMDKMKNLGVKQACFIIDYEWKKGAAEVNLKVREVRYYSEYYRNDKIIKDGKTLGLISQTGLEDDLKKAVLVNARKQFQPYKKGDVKKSYVYEYLLDDENLPIITYVE